VSVQYRRLHEWCLLAGLVLATSLGLASAAVAQAAPPPAPSAAAPRPADAAPAAPSPTGEPVALPKNLADALARIGGALDGAEKALQHLNNVEEDLSKLRINVEDILADASQTAEALRPELALVRTQIEKLGPPPAKDAPAESPAIAAERARLTALASQLDGAIKSTELTWVRARQLIERITVMRHAIFTKNLMERLPSPLLPGLWRDLFNETPGVIHRFNYLAEDWLHWAEQKRLQLSLLFVAVVLLFVVLWRLTTRLTGRRVIRLDRSPEGAGRGRRGDAALWRARRAGAALSTLGAGRRRHSQGDHRVRRRLDVDHRRAGPARTELAPGGAVQRLGKAYCTSADRHGGGLCHRRRPHRDQPSLLRTADA
jgi:small-conductance mechanosensitive channel